MLRGRLRRIMREGLVEGFAENLAEGFKEGLFYRYHGRQIHTEGLVEV